MPEVAIPSPDQFAAAGPWAAFAFLAIAVIALSFYLLKLLFQREFKRSDAAEAELVAIKRQLAEANSNGIEATAEIRRLRRLLATYEESDERLARRRGRKRRSDDA